MESEEVNNFNELDFKEVNVKQNRELKETVKFINKWKKLKYSQYKDIFNRLVSNSHGIPDP
mgnify:CR=1 FL=1|jgi:hypothetical protein